MYNQCEKRFKQTGCSHLSLLSQVLCNSLAPAVLQKPLGCSRIVALAFRIHVGSDDGDARPQRLSLVEGILGPGPALRHRPYSPLSLSPPVPPGSNAKFLVSTQSRPLAPHQQPLNLGFHSQCIFQCENLDSLAILPQQVKKRIRI